MGFLTRVFLSSGGSGFVLGVAGRVLECVAFEPDLVDGFFDGVEAAVEGFIGRYWVHWF